MIGDLQRTPHALRLFREAKIREELADILRAR